MGSSHYYSLKINGLADRSTAGDVTVSLTRMAQYLLEFSKILGHKEQVRFKSIERGSILAIAEVSDPGTKEDIEDRIAFARSWLFTGQRRVPTETAAFTRLNKMLAEDHSTGAIGYAEDLDELDFITLLDLGDLTGEEYEPIYQQGSLDGFIVRMGDSPYTPDVPIHLQNRSGDKYLCRATRELAFEMTSHPYGMYFRVYGSGEWSKEVGRRWRVKKFKIEKYEILESDQSFKQILARIRKTQFVKNLSEIENPAGYLRSLREKGRS